MLVKFTGLLKKEIEVEDEMTVGTLKNMVAQMIGRGCNSFLIVAKGKKLTDKFDEKKMSEMKFKVRKSGKLVCIVMKQKGTSNIEQKEEKKVEEKGPSRAIISTNPVSSSQADEVDIKRILETAEKLAKKNDDGIGYRSNYFLELTDSSGKKVFFPQKDREAISLGLTLHEKGKEYRKRGGDMWATSLELFLLSYKALNSVDKKFICMIDNFPILCLDIVWMYYRMNDSKNLKEAYRYLQEAEKGFERAYGKNLERLQAFRSNEFCPEQVLLIRLKILQAINAYYQGDIRRADNILLLAQLDMRKLSVSDQHIAQIVSIGFSQSHARKALRVNKNNIEASIGYLLQIQEDRKRAEEEENRRLEKRRRARRYGLTHDRKVVDIDLLDGLKNSEVTSHIPTELIAEAIRVACNDREKTLDIILNPVSLENLGKAVEERKVQREKIRKVRDAGFSREESKRALKSCGWNPKLAVNILKMGYITKLGYSLQEARSALAKTEQDVDRALDLLVKTDRVEEDDHVALQSELPVAAEMNVDSLGSCDKKEASSQQEALQSDLPVATEMDLGSIAASDEKETPSEQTAQNNFSPEADTVQMAKEMLAVAARMDREERKNRGNQSQDEDTPSEEKVTEERGSAMNMDLVMSAIENAEDPDSHLDSDLVAEANAIEELKSILAATKMSA